MRHSGSTIRVTELQSLDFRFPGEGSDPCQYLLVSLSYLDPAGQPQRAHHLARKPCTDPVLNIAGLLGQTFTQFGDQLVNSPLPMGDEREALGSVQETLARFYGALRTALVEQGRPPGLVAVSHDIAETAYALEVVLLQMVSAVLGLDNDARAASTVETDRIPFARLVRDEDHQLVPETALNATAWVNAHVDSKEMRKTLSRVFADHPVDTLYVVPPLDSDDHGKNGKLRDEQVGGDRLRLRRLDRQNHLFKTIEDAPAAPLINPHEHGGLIASLVRFAHFDHQEDPISFLHPSHTSDYIPAVLDALLPGRPNVRFSMLVGVDGRAASTLPVFDDERFWRSALATSTTQTRTSGSLISHYGGEPPNYYPEEQYLVPVGPVGSKARLLQKAALLQGYNTLQYSRGSFALIDNEDRHLLFHSSATPLNSAAAKAVCNDKETTRLILQRNDIPVPRGRVFKNGDVEGALAYADRLGFPLVVKPAMGTMGIGVRAGIQDREEMRDALDFVAASRLGSQDFIVEQHIFGDEYRILVVGDEVIAAVQRVPASVVGDGRHTVAELIVRKNAFRRTNPQLASSPIVYSQDTDQTLDRQGMTLLSVPDPDQHVVLSSSSNISLGGDSREMSDRLHPTVIDAAIRAVKAIPGLNYCGVDFLLPDPTKSIHEQHTGICELNAQAATGTAQYPLYGTSRPVPQRTIQAVERKFLLRPVQQEQGSQVSLQLTIRGRIMNVGFHRWFERWAIEFGVVGRLYDLNDRIIRVEMMGEPDAIAALSAAAVGGPRRARPTSVISQHIPPLPYTDFQYVTPWTLRVRRAAGEVRARILRLVRR